MNAKYPVGDNVDFKALFDRIIADTSLAEKLEPVARLLMTTNDRVAKSVVKSVQRCIYQYQTMMARTLNHN